MDNINDLLNQINSSKLFNKTDADIYRSEKRCKWTKDKVEKLVDEYYQSGQSLTMFFKDKSMSRKDFARLCKKWKIQVESQCDFKKTMDEVNLQRILNNPRHVDIMNGMSCKDWLNKWNTSNKGNFYHYRKLLREKGLVD